MNKEEILQLVETAACQLELLKKNVNEWQYNETEPFYKDIKNIDSSIKLSKTIAETLLMTIGTSREELSKLVYRLENIKKERNKAIDEKNAIDTINRLVNVSDDQNVAFALIHYLWHGGMVLVEKIDIPKDRQESVLARYRENLEKMAKDNSYYQQFLK